ncbi:MAG TPA: magnesium transporter, partial [Clostridiales bacterium]|nr:magnesium transporter [Clostridiales bacterium]
AFMPMLMGTGGNAGSQVSTLVIRGMALGEIQLKDILKVIWKELRVSIIVGAILSSINFVRIVYFEKFDIKIGLVVCITLFFVVILAKIIGGTLPIIAKLFRVDPAIMASPLISTFIDAISLFVYFSLASLILGIG